MDFAIPRDNEGEFAEIALRLGFKKLVFLYDPNEFIKDKIQSKLEKLEAQINIEVGFMVNSQNINKAQQHSRILAARSSEKDLLLVESKKINLIFKCIEVFLK